MSRPFKEIRLWSKWLLHRFHSIKITSILQKLKLCNFLNIEGPNSFKHGARVKQELCKVTSSEGGTTENRQIDNDSDKERIAKEEERVVHAAGQDIRVDE